MTGTATCGGDTWLGPCRERATVHARAACVHEHLRDGVLCADHAARLDLADCAECYDGPSGHRCLLGAWQVTPLTAVQP